MAPYCTVYILYTIWIQEFFYFSLLTGGLAFSSCFPFLKLPLWGLSWLDTGEGREKPWARHQLIVGIRAYTLYFVFQMIKNIYFY